MIIERFGRYNVRASAAACLLARLPAPCALRALTPPPPATPAPSPHPSARIVPHYSGP